MLSTKLSKYVFEKTYHDTLMLLLRSESFLENYSSQTELHDKPLYEARIDCEMTRITARLTRVMAWLLAQKALYEGALPLEEAQSIKYQIVRDPFCLKDSLKGQERALPPTVKDLLSDSLDLYRRALVLCENNFTISLDQKPESEN
jgi:regulator of CtrA degradation